MPEYKNVCERCNQEFVFYRRHLSPASYRPRFCGKCRRLSYVKNQNSHKHTEARYLDSVGYAHTLIDGKYVSEHRYRMGQMLGRKLKSGESVHHIDGDRANNNPQNLELWLNPQLAGIRAQDLICPHCGKPYSSF